MPREAFSLVREFQTIVEIAHLRVDVKVFRCCFGDARSVEVVDVEATADVRYVRVVKLVGQ